MLDILGVTTAKQKTKLIWASLGVAKETEGQTSPKNGPKIQGAGAA